MRPVQGARRCGVSLLVCVVRSCILRESERERTSESEKREGGEGDRTSPERGASVDFASGDRAKASVELTLRRSREGGDRHATRFEAREPLGAQERSVSSVPREFGSERGTGSAWRGAHDTLAVVVRRLLRPCSDVRQPVLAQDTAPRDGWDLAIQTYNRFINTCENANGRGRVFVLGGVLHGRVFQREHAT